MRAMCGLLLLWKDWQCTVSAGMCSRDCEGALDVIERMFCESEVTLQRIYEQDRLNGFRRNCYPFFVNPYDVGSHDHREDSERGALRLRGSLGGPQPGADDRDHDAGRGGAPDLRTGQDGDHSKWTGCRACSFQDGLWEEKGSPSSSWMNRHSSRTARSCVTRRRVGCRSTTNKIAAQSAG